MTDQAFRIYEQALSEQHSRNEARRIRTRVSEARGRPHAAGVRWPFELMQNALDSGPRQGNESVAIRIRRQPSGVVFEHDGAPFTSVELAALLSGGSSKDFESDVTTGRFGTGFLVTHVLAERVRLQGLLDVGDHFEQFHLVLDRSGNEENILQNIFACNAAIRAATSLEANPRVQSATFEYSIPEGSTTFTAGFEALTRALPYLYGTRPTLGRIEIESEDGCIEIWSSDPLASQSFREGYLQCRSITIERSRAPTRKLDVFRFMTTPEAHAAALLAVEHVGGAPTVLVPDLQTPRVFRDYPLRGATFVPLNFILDGKFEPDQERSGLLMGDKDKALLQDALNAAVLGVRYALERCWSGMHLLASTRVPSTVFDPSSGEELQWWREQLLATAEKFGKLPIVDCGEQGYLPAVTDSGSYADFVIPRLSTRSSEDETTVERLWPLVYETTDLYPPRRELAKDWTAICEGWHTLGINVDESRVSVEKLAQFVRQNAGTLEQLRVRCDQQSWLARFLDVVGECWERREGSDPSVLDGLLPNQNSRLCAPSNLRRDDGICSDLKDICSQLGHDIRDQLLLDGFDHLAERDGLTFLPAMLETAVSTRLSESTLLEETVRYLGDKLPEDEDCEDDSGELEKGSVRLLRYLWESRGQAAATIARVLPLISRKRRVVRWSPERLMMAPVCTWHESARPFAAAYPENRILADLYSESDNPDNCIAALVNWRMAIADPLAFDEPMDLRDRRLAAIASCDTTNIVVSGERFSQIALLQPEVLNRCKVGVEEARALLGLVLNHIAPHDASWESKRTVKARRGREDIDLVVQEALWLADLKFMAWVPIFEEQEKSPVPHLANANTLTGLLDSKWLENNDPAIRLLSQWFGFDELELRLLGVAADAGKRQELRTSLAKLVETGGANAELYASLARELLTRQRMERDVAFCRRLGLAVQEAVAQALATWGLDLVLVDRGFDYEVTPGSDHVVEEPASHIQVGPFLLEIKATTRGGACLTPTQAATASSEATFVLCVVDLRSVPAEELEGEWSAGKVVPLARIVPNIGQYIERTWRFVESARASTVGIRNDSALRYEVPIEVWEQGISISEWVHSLGRSPSTESR